MSKQQYHYHKTTVGFGWLVWLVFFVITKLYRITADIPTELRTTKGPYLIIANKLGFWDRFIISHFMQQRPLFVSTDYSHRTGIKGFLLRRTAYIGHSSSQLGPQMQWLTTAIAAGQSVGIFRQTSNNNAPIAQVIRTLAIPVITARSQGLSLFWPSFANIWGRAGQMHIQFGLVATPLQLRAMPVGKLQEQIDANLKHDEIQYHSQHKIEIAPAQRAKHLRNQIFYCRSCQSYSGYKAKDSNICCKQCGASIAIDKHGSLLTYSKNKKRKQAAKLRKILSQQQQQFYKHLEQYTNNSEVIFCGENIKVYRANAYDDYKLLGKATLTLFANRIVAYFSDGTKQEFKIKYIDSFCVEQDQYLELSYKTEPYRLRTQNGELDCSKWHMAYNFLQEQRMSSKS